MGDKLRNFYVKFQENFDFFSTQTSFDCALELEMFGVCH